MNFNVIREPERCALIGESGSITDAKLMKDCMQSLLAGKANNYIAPFLWLHNEDDALIIEELTRIHACGIRAVCLESRTHEEFCREDWWSDCRLILDFCREHDMNVWILDDKHFPSGYGNGIYEKHPELVQWNIVERHMDVVGPVREGSIYADGWTNLPDDEILGVFACRHIPNSDVLTDEIVDLTGQMSDGYVYFDLPVGMWRMVFLIKTRGGLSHMVLHYSDKLRAESTQAYIDEVYEAHYEHLSAYFGNTLLGFFSDEPEFGNHTGISGWNPVTERIHMHHPWSDSVRAHFEGLYGQNALRNLLPLWFDFEGLPAEEYRIAYMNFITDAYAENYTGLIADWCHAHGVRYIGHVVEDNNIHHGTVHGTGHYFKSLRAQDMAGVDVVLHQIVPGLTECNHAALVGYREVNANFFNYTLAKLASSLAHITPHMNRRAMCELFGAYGWAEGTKIMKYLCDHMLVRGINYFVPHAFSPKPNDPDCPPNFYATGENPQYRYFGRIMGYMNRACTLLEGSIHVNTCAILYDAESAWSRQPFLPLDNVAKVLYDHQLDFDILPLESLTDVDDEGCINGEHYGLILVPACDYIRPAVRDRLHRCGVRVAVVGADSDEDFATVSLDRLPTYVRELGLGDVIMTNHNIHLRYHHAVRGGTHIYLFTNEDVEHTVDTDVVLRGFPGGRYIRYDAFENRAEVVEADRVHIALAPYNSVFILCGDIDCEGIPVARPSVAAASKVLTPDFTVSLRERDTDGFSFYKKTADLFNITGQRERPRFSGTVRYTATVDLAGDETVLDLGEVGETAELFLNGECAGVRLFPPYRFSVAGLAREGANELEVLVTNTLGYRIHDMFSKYLMLLPTGMLGPIRAERPRIISETENQPYVRRAKGNWNHEN